MSFYSVFAHAYIFIIYISSKIIKHLFKLYLFSTKLLDF